MMHANPVNWFDISVSNLERAKHFYETVFDIRLVEFPTEWGRQAAFPSNNEGPNASGALVEKADRVANGNNTIVYFSTKECTAEERRVEKAGGSVINPKTSIGEFGFVSILMDTEGNIIGLHSQE
ncbi:VOC family protein [Hymenobacter mucosus]|nr:VOC family protein [Hymenobacter mucosus]